MPEQGINTPELTLTEQQRRIETINFNPTADCILASSSDDTLTLWDLIVAEELYTFDVGNILFSTLFPNLPEYLNPGYKTR